MGHDYQALVLEALGLASWLRNDDETFAPVGNLPDWWSLVSNKREALKVTDLDSDFVDNFMVDAELLWGGNRSDKIDSGIWEYQTAYGGYLLLQIHAVKSAQANLLIFQDLDATDVVWRDLLQSGRQRQLTLLHDISQRKQLELELRRAKENAERLERAKMEFYAKTNHEFRTPLTSILAMTELASETNLDSKQREYITVTRKSAETLLRIMNDVLDFSKIEHGSLSIDCSSFSIAELLADLERDFVPAAEEREIQFQTEIEGKPGSMFSDPVRLRQILNNLVHNALRFTDHGGVTVRAIVSGSEKEGAHHSQIRFEVADTGCGIPPNQQQRIFDSFVQGDKDDGLLRGGTGLGLSIASKLVEMLGGGPLSLESQPGEGTTFFFSVPRTMESEDISSIRAPSPGHPSADLSVLQGRVVLVAEDNPVNRSYACHVLTKAGINVVEAENGRQAVAMTKDKAPDLVLMDCRMPECNGIEAATQIRAHEREAGGHVPIIAVTAHAMDQDVDRCLAAGMDDYISKPFKKQELLQKLADLVS